MAQEETRLHTEATEAVALPSRGAPSGGEGPAGSVRPCCDPPVTGEAAGQAGPGLGRCPVLLSSEAAHGADLPAGRPKGPGCWLHAGCVSPGACGTRAGP